MQALAGMTPAFLGMARHIVCCSAASVDPRGRPRSRVLDPIWPRDGGRLVGWVGRGPTPLGPPSRERRRVEP